MSQPCGMWPGRWSVECGKPATLCWEKDGGGIVPICNECIAWTGQSRKYLKKLPDSTISATTPEVKPEAPSAK